MEGSRLEFNHLRFWNHGFRMAIVASAALSVLGCAHSHTRRGHGLLDGAIPSRNDRHSERVANADQMETLPAVEVLHLRKKTEQWIWPLNGLKVTSAFGPRVGHVHEGIDLHAPVGTEVFAVSDGVVAYAGGRISGYGKMVVIKHGDGVSSVYAHNSRLLVRTGQRVRIGQKISYSGNTGHSTGPHLHFEIRKGVLAVDPESYLPNRETVLANRSRIGNFRTVSSLGSSRRSKPKKFRTVAFKKIRPSSRKVAKKTGKKQRRNSNASRSRNSSATELASTNRNQ